VLTDLYGLFVSTNTSTVIDAVNHFQQQLISSGQDGAEILETAKSNPENLLLQCYAAVFLIYAQDQSLNPKISVFLTQAESLLKYANQRERLFYQATSAWFQYDYELALTIFIAITEQWSTDCTAAKIAEWLFYCTGQKYNAKRFLAMCEKMAPRNQQRNHFLAIHAFALELDTDYTKSFKVASRALEIDVKTPWAHHAISHVFLRTGKMFEGSQALESFSPTWQKILWLLRGHNSWHLALFYLAELNEQKTIELYDHVIWAGASPDNTLEQIDAVALLWRMDMVGISTTHKWQDIAKHLLHHSSDHYMPFNNGHFVYALTRANKSDLALTAIANVEKYARTLKGSQQDLWLRITIPFLKGCHAFASQDYRTVQQLWQPIISDIYQVGGSDAQVELFFQAYYYSCLKNKESSHANKFFETHLSHYQNTPLGQHWSNL
jgi:hypothetical protein